MVYFVKLAKCESQSDEIFVSDCTAMGRYFQNCMWMNQRGTNKTPRPVVNSFYLQSACLLHNPRTVQWRVSPQIGLCSVSNHLLVADPFFSERVRQYSTRNRKSFDLQYLLQINHSKLELLWTFIATLFVTDLCAFVRCSSNCDNRFGNRGGPSLQLCLNRVYPIVLRNH